MVRDERHIEKGTINEKLRYLKLVFRIILLVFMCRLLGDENALKHALVKRVAHSCTTNALLSIYSHFLFYTLNIANKVILNGIPSVKISTFSLNLFKNLNFFEVHS